MNSTPENIILSTHQLSIGYRESQQGQRILASSLNLSLAGGKVVSLLGPNGSGKSTLLRTLAGLQPALQGRIEILGKPVRSNQVRQTARLLSIVLTGRIEVRHLTVFDLVTMGRYPYSQWLGQMTQADRDAVTKSLEEVGMWDYRDRFVNELSDGEQQRVLFAKALAQATPLILLDEPTAHLDLPNRVSLMHLLRHLADETGRTILFSSHDLDLSIQVADELWLMGRDGHFLTGSPQSLSKGTLFEDIFTPSVNESGKNELSSYFRRLRDSLDSE